MAEADLRKELEGMIERILKFTDPNEDIRAVICRVYLDGYEAGMARTVREYELGIRGASGLQLQATDESQQ